MNFKIFKTSPRLVFLNNNKVYKFFKSGLECREEIRTISKLPLFQEYDETTKYKIKFIKILEKNENFYVMELLKGNCININNSLEDFHLAGIWLKYFHKLTYDKKNKKVFSFGDFVPNHLFIDHKHKEIAALDPGHTFGTINIIEKDIAAFIVGLIQTKNFKIFKLYKVIKIFLKGYGINKIDYYILNKCIKLEILRKLNQTISLGDRFNRYIIAYYFLIFTSLKYFLIKKKLKEG